MSAYGELNRSRSGDERPLAPLDSGSAPKSEVGSSVLIAHGNVSETGRSETVEEQDQIPQKLFEALRFTVPRCFLAFVLVVVIAFLRRPYTELPQALFVSDGFGYYIYLPSAVIDRDLDLSNQITQIPYEGKKQFYQIASKTGRTTNQFPVGSAIFWLPFFLVADLAVVVLGMVGWPVDRSGFGYFYELPVYVGSFAYGLAAIYLMQRTLDRLFPKPIAWASLFGVVFRDAIGILLLGRAEHVAHRRDVFHFTLALAPSGGLRGSRRSLADVDSSGWPFRPCRAGATLQRRVGLGGDSRCLFRHSSQ